MKLSVLERLALLGILPREGSYTILKIMRDLREQLSFNEAEHKALGFREEAEQVHWNPAADPVADFEFGERATDIIVTELKKLNGQERLPEDAFSLYERFVENGSK